MATVYVASTETFVGKSAVCVGLLERARRDGFSIGYMKPVSVSVTRTEDAAFDEDAAFVKRHFNMQDSLERLAPIQLTNSVIDRVMRGQTQDFSKRLSESYLAVSKDRDFVVLEGANHWAEGTLVNLSTDQISDMLQAPVLLVTHYRSTLAVDAVLAVQRYLGDRLVGVIINQVDPNQMEFVESRVAPYLESKQVPVFAALSRDPQLAGMSVADLHEHLGGQLLGQTAWADRMIESLVIGAMGADAALSHFRRRPNKAVITGGDRSDLQLAALETSTSALILTGNIRPSARVIDAAEDRQVPILLVADDTITAVERAESVFGRIRFKQEAKIAQFTKLLDERLDEQRLYDKIGLVKS